jgi:hypothetical protein
MLYHFNWFLVAKFSKNEMIKYFLNCYHIIYNEQAFEPKNVKQMLFDNLCIDFVLIKREKEKSAT